MRRILFLAIIIAMIMIPARAAFPPPEANFTTNETNVCMFDTIQFTDTSTSYGTLSAWFWLFGDSQDSHSQDPTHYYDTAGTYDVSLWVQDFWGENTTVKTNYITVRDCLVLQFDANTTCQIGKPLAVQFGSNCPAADKSHWEFGDGNTSDLTSPTYTYPDYGIYTINLTCKDPLYGTRETNKSDYITVGVNGTFCSCPECVTCNAPSDSGGEAIVIVFGIIAVLIAAPLILRRRRKRGEQP